MIAVTGATGFVGGAVARVLAERGVAQRLVVREPARAPQLERAEVRVARAYGDADAMRAALDGVETLFLVPAEEATDRVTQHRTAIDAAVAAGVRRIVYLSFLGVIAGPAGEGRAGIVSRADVADVVVGLLTSGGHDGATYDVTGREALTVGEMAATLARCSGRPIAYKDETLEEARASRASMARPRGRSTRGSAPTRRSRPASWTA